MGAAAAEPLSEPVALVADDDREVRELVAGFLRREGYSVLEAGDGIEALHLASTYRPDLTILDVLMPGLTGFEVAYELRCSPETEDMAIMMLSGHGTQDDVLIGLAAGADDYVTKPFSRRRLQLRLRDLVSNAA